MNIYFKIIFYVSIIATQISYSNARKDYEELNKDPKNPFAFFFGTSISQTHTTNNTLHPDSIMSQLKKVALKQWDPKAWLTSANRIWYTLRCLPVITCQECQKTYNPVSFDIEKDKTLISNMINNALQNNTPMLQVTKCPQCLSKKITTSFQPNNHLEAKEKDLFVQQIQSLRLNQQLGCATGTMPNYRLSLEACDVLKDNSIEIDPEKLQTLSAWIQKIGNPLLFFHHYANPAQIPNLFEKTEHLSWFSQYCAQIIAANPQITHVCPISQPAALTIRLNNQTLPPFECSLSAKDYFNNLINAHCAAYDAIKKENPNVQVFISHQWKPILPFHQPNDPRYYFELIVCQMVHTMYNIAFINAAKQHIDKFDGLALSVYPPAYIDMITPTGTGNCSGTIDAEKSLECVMQIHKHFPDKKIIIIEAGCNIQDETKQRYFIDTMFSVCKQARTMGASILGLSLWTHTNDPAWYTEWNCAPGSTHFGMFDTLSPDSLTGFGKYIKEILAPKNI